MVKKQCIKSILLTFLSNARYIDYENPIEYLENQIAFFEKNPLFTYTDEVVSEPINQLLDCEIIANNIRDEFGYETPYRFDISLKKDDTTYNLPVINYGIKDGVCYIYSIQNKNQKVRTIMK